MPRAENGIKICSKCRTPFPATHEFFVHQSHSIDGLFPYCRTCHNAYGRAWHADPSPSRPHGVLSAEEKRANRLAKQHLYTARMKNDPEWRENRRLASKACKQRQRLKRALEPKPPKKRVDPEVVKAQRKAYKQGWAQENKSRLATRLRNYMATLRQEMITMYGGKCACCGEIEPRFLTLEHVNGNGYQERKHCSSHSILVRLQKQGWPREGYTILCMNCNWGTRTGALCPHALRAGVPPQSEPLPSSPNAAKQRKSKRRLRAQFLAAYGNACSCCGETAEPFLTLEHLQHDAVEHRKQVGKSGLLRDLRDRGWPQDGAYTVYCMNCNFATRFGETCPHKTK